MTMETLIKVLVENNIPEDVEIHVDADCWDGGKQVTSIWYNKVKNTICLSQYERPFHATATEYWTNDWDIIHLEE